MPGARLLVRVGEAAAVGQLMLETLISGFPDEQAPGARLLAFNGNAAAVGQLMKKTLDSGFLDKQAPRMACPRRSATMLESPVNQGMIYAGVRGAPARPGW